MSFTSRYVYKYRLQKVYTKIYSGKFKVKLLKQQVLVDIHACVVGALHRNSPTMMKVTLILLLRFGIRELTFSIGIVPDTLLKRHL